MTNEKVKRMLDACYQAKRIRELLPPLPQGVMPSYRLINGRKLRNSPNFLLYSFAHTA